MELTYDIVTEGARFDSFKERIKQVCSTAKRIITNALNTIRTIVAKLMNKVFHTKTVMFNRNYYNEIMAIINKVQAMNITPLAKIKMYFNAARLDYDKLNKIQTEYANQLQDLADMSQNISKIVPAKTGPTITITEGYFNKMRMDFRKMQQAYANELQNTDIIYQIANDYLENYIKDNPDSMEKVNSISEVVGLITTVVSRNGRLNMLRATLLINLTNLLTKNIIKDEVPKDYTDAKYRNVKTPKNDAQTTNRTERNNPNIRLLTVNESLTNFIDYCDDMMITEESLTRAKKTYKNEINGLKENLHDVTNMPDNTKEEIATKLKEIKNQREDIKDLLRRLKSEKVDFVDRLISGAAHLTRAGIGAAGTVTAFSLNSSFAHFDSAYLRIWKDIAIILGATKLSDLVKKATTANKREFIETAMRDLRSKDRQLIQLESALNDKLKSL